jgi:hypothetical protein
MTHIKLDENTKLVESPLNYKGSKKDLLKKLKQKLENSWSSFSQVIEEIESIDDILKYDCENTDDNPIIPKYDISKKDKEDLEVFYENHLDELKYQTEILQGQSQDVIEHFENIYNLEEE